MSAAAVTYRLGAYTWRSADGRSLVGGRPTRRLRLSAAGAAALDALLTGRSAPGVAALEERLRDQGLIDPIAEASAEHRGLIRPGTGGSARDQGLIDPITGPGAAAVTFVVPTRDGGPALAELVAALAPHGEVIVVDDGSRDGSPELARRAGARVVANDGEPGPAGARNRGCELAATDLVAFVDADCRVSGDWARPLAALLVADPGLAVVAPRVRGAAGPSRLDRWETIRSPLDMGPSGGLVGPGRAVSYVPSAALVARRSALAELDGFDPALRFGEDVDLIWRLVAAGWRVRYAPETEVEHPARPTVRARLRQHFEYGTSAAALERRHPGAAGALRLTPRTVPPALVLAGNGVAGILAGGAMAAVVVARQDADVRPAVARLALLGQREAGRALVRAVTREWLPLALAASLRSPRARRLTATALAVDLLSTVVADPGAGPTHIALRLGDNAAYTAGLWRGAIAARSPRALLPTTHNPFLVLQKY